MDLLSRDAHFFALILFVWVFLSAKNLAFVLFSLAILAIVYGNSRRLVGCTMALRLSVPAMFLTIVSLFSPVDIYVQRGNTLSLEVKPVVVQSGRLEVSRELRRAGKIPGRDFVIYERVSFFNQVQWAVTITVP